MVRLVDLGEVGSEDTAPHDVAKQFGSTWKDGNRPNPNFSSRFSVALSCYPIISQLASHVDLNTLHELSRTCRQFRANLLQYRKLLIRSTLQCNNENANPALRLGEALNASFEQWTAYGRNGVKIGRISSGKVGACARDMVGECRRCGQVVCRNCIFKPPSISIMKDRHRRICKKCMKSPIKQLTVVRRTTDEEDDSSQPLYARSPCTCGAGPWLCKPCGQPLRTADTTYVRGWVWRTRYSACGGIGAGLGEGNEGVECGRSGDCLDAREVEKEIECDAEEIAALDAEMHKAEIDGRQWAGSSYNMHEMVGIGGKVKKKIKRRVPVGACTKEYEDERMTRNFLRREQEGVNRSWCSWCERVVPGKKDLDLADKSTESVASWSSSTSSDSLPK